MHQFDVSTVDAQSVMAGGIGTKSSYSQQIIEERHAPRSQRAGSNRNSTHQYVDTAEVHNTSGRFGMTDNRIGDSLKGSLNSHGDYQLDNNSPEKEIEI